MGSSCFGLGCFFEATHGICCIEIRQNVSKGGVIMLMVIFIFGPDELHGRAEFPPPFVGDGSFEVGEDVEDDDGNVKFYAIGRYSFGLGF